MIRKGEYKDIEGVKELIKEFFQESLAWYKISLDDETITETMKSFVDKHISFVAEENGKIIGVIAGIISPSIFDKRQLFAQEAIWYVTKKARGIVGFKLIKVFEEECRKLGAKMISMICMSNLNFDILDRFYKNDGFALLENHYIKEV